MDEDRFSHEQELLRPKPNASVGPRREMLSHSIPLNR